MKDIKRKWDLISEEKRKQCIDEIIDYFKREREEEIGVIAAEDFLDFFLQLTAEDIHSKGVQDAKTVIKKRLDDLEVDLDLLGSTNQN